MNEIHFRSFTEYSCGDTLGKPQTDDPAQVTCRICSCEYIRLTEMEPAMHNNDIRFAAHVETETAQLDPAQVRACAVEILRDAGGSALTQSRHALAEAREEGDAALYALWQAVQIELLEMGPPFPIYS